MAYRFDPVLNIPKRSGPRLDADIAAYVAVLEETRSLSNAEKRALQDDKDRGVANGWWDKMYDRILLGWADATANAVRQKTPASTGTFGGTPTHSAGYVDFAGSDYLKFWAPSAAFSSVNSMGMFYGLAADDATNPNCIDMGVRNNPSGAENDLTVRGYGSAFASFGNTTTARILTAVASVTKGFYLGHRTSSSAGRLRYLLSGGSPTTLVSSGSLSGGSLNTNPFTLAGYGFGASQDNFSNRRYSQVASLDGLTDAEADAFLEDALTLEQELGWRT